MLFNSVEFLMFFPVVCVLYYLTPYRFRYLLLLAAGYIFYAFAEPSAVLVLLLTTVVTWIGGKLLYDGKKNGFLWLAAAFLILAYFKYFAYICSLFGKGEVSILLPIGISFYTFQSATYLLDCYNHTCSPQKNFFKYALFVSFFPTILSGPIARAKDLLPQFDEEHDFDTLQAKEGLVSMLWGYFLKMVLVSRLTLLTDLVFGDASMRGLPVLVAVLAYSFQIYCDFAGYSYIAIGCAKIMGFRLPQNFRQPYLATSVADFWRRWHISLSSWFRDYLYIPLGGNRKGMFRKYVNVLIVFAVSGIWHGANITFLVWGLLNGIYQVISGVFSKVGRASGEPHGSAGAQTVVNSHASGRGPAGGVRIALTFLLMTLTWVFFRAPSVPEALDTLQRLCGPYIRPLLDGTLFTLGLGVKNLLFAAAALVILIAADIACEKKKCDITGLLTHVKWPVRWALYYVVIIMILFSCNLSTQEFLYFKF
ncbi:MAG: MBOAT family protein [Lachnospiraceae bacterium]|nr:MBOAT family protein [Lachnospiraceae bacterium]